MDEIARLKEIVEECQNQLKALSKHNPNVVKNVELGDRSILMILSSKNTVHGKHLHGQNASIQTMGTFYDQDILRIIRDFTYLRPAYYSLTESTNVFRNIKLDDGDIMVILSSAGPIDIDGVTGGNNSVLIAGQMSPENVASVLQLCGIQVNGTKLSEVYMLVSKCFVPIISVEPGIVAESVY